MGTVSGIGDVAARLKAMETGPAATQAMEQRETAVLDVNGEAVWVFAKPYPTKPVVSHIYSETQDMMPIILKVKEFTIESGKYTKVTVKGYRLRKLPTVTPLQGSISLITSLTPAINIELAKLSEFNPIVSTGLSGIEIHLSAGLKSS